MTLRKSAKETLPVPPLSTSPIIFLISSFFGSKPRALIATWRNMKTQVHLDSLPDTCWTCSGSQLSTSFSHLELFDIDESRTIGVKQLEGLSDLLLLLLGQLCLGGGLLTRRRHWALQGGSLGTGRLRWTQEGRYNYKIWKLNMESPRLWWHHNQRGFWEREKKAITQNL